MIDSMKGREVTPWKGWKPDGDKKFVDGTKKRFRQISAITDETLARFTEVRPSYMSNDDFLHKMIVLWEKEHPRPSDLSKVIKL